MPKSRNGRILPFRLRLREKKKGLLKPFQRSFKGVSKAFKDLLKGFQKLFSVKILGKPLASHSSSHPSDPGRLPRDSLLYHFGSKISTSNGNKRSSTAACMRARWLQAGLGRAVGGQPPSRLGPLSYTFMRCPQIPPHPILGILRLSTGYQP